MTNGLNDLLSLLDLERTDDDEFVGVASQERHVRAFGGQIAAQTLVAAGRTVDPGRSVHSLHSYFLRPGQPQETTTFRVQQIRDGRSFSVRQVDAVQGDKVIFSLTASFHQDEVGVSHAVAMPVAPEPESLQSFEQRFSGREGESDMERWFVRARPFDIRYVGATPFDPPTTNHEPHQQVWFKTTAPLPEDALVHRCVAAYASDMTMLDAILLTHGMRWTDRAVMGASLDHAMWFHAPFRADEWLLFDQVSPTTGGGRGLARGEVWTQDGRLVMSIIQEALLRPPGESRPVQQEST